MQATICLPKACLLFFFSHNAKYTGVKKIQPSSEHLCKLQKTQGLMARNEIRSQGMQPLIRMSCSIPVLDGAQGHLYQTTISLAPSAWLRLLL